MSYRDSVGTTGQFGVGANTLALRATAGEHMAMLEQNPEGVISYFQDSRVRYAA